MPRERDDRPQHDQHDAHDHAATQDVANRQLDLPRAVILRSFGRRPVCWLLGHPRIPLHIIWPEIHNRTTTNTSRIVELCSFGNKYDPPTAPINTPTATGAAMNGSISPRM